MFRLEITYQSRQPATKQLDNRVMMNTAPTIDKIRDTIIGKNRLDQLLVIGKVAKNNGYVPESIVVLTAQTQNVLRCRLHLRPPLGRLDNDNILHRNLI